MSDICSFIYIIQYTSLKQEFRMYNRFQYKEKKNYKKLSLQFKVNKCYKYILLYCYLISFFKHIKKYLQQ